MRQKGYIQIFAVLLLLVPFKLISQNCENHHLDGDCRYDIQKGYKIYSQSHSARVAPLDTLEVDAVFYGQKDYILSFCTHKKMYPIHFVLIDKQTNQLLYDNEEDRYLESLGLGFDVTKSLIIRVNALARESTEEEIKENIGCIGILIQYKNYPNKKVKLQM